MKKEVFLRSELIRRLMRATNTQSQDDSDSDSDSDSDYTKVARRTRRVSFASAARVFLCVSV